MSNKEMVAEFYERFFNQHDVDSALEFVKEDYIQHNPGVPQGRQGLMDAFREKFIAHPEFNLKIVRIVEEDDIVVMYLKNLDTEGNTRARIIDMFRIEDGKLAEHWDVIQGC